MAHGPWLPVVEESCGHLHDPAIPVSHQEIRTSKKIINRQTGYVPVAKVATDVCSQTLPSPSAAWPSLFPHAHVSLLVLHSSCLLVPLVFFSFYLHSFLLHPRWPPPCVSVELLSPQRFPSTGDGVRQHIKMGHTLRAASLSTCICRTLPLPCLRTPCYPSFSLYLPSFPSPD